MKKRVWLEKIKRLVRENQFLLKPFLIMMVIYLVGMLSIILVGVHFADDIARTNYGYAGWNGFSRYLSTVLAYGLHTDGYLFNIAPLPQILAVVILAAASILLILVIAGKDVFKKPTSKWMWLLVAVVPLGLSPYMLECLAYQYDAPYMALSVLFAILPILFCQRSKVIYGLAILIGVMVICTTYQAAIGIFPMIVIFVAMKNWSESNKLKKRGNLKWVAFSAVAFLMSLILFQQFLMKPRDAYASNSLPELPKLIPEFFEHLGQYLMLVLKDFKIWWLVLIVIIVMGFVTLFIIRSKRNKILAGCMAMVGVVMLIVLAFAFYAVLEKPLYATRAMYPLGAAIAILAVYVVAGKGGGWLMKIPIGILVWGFLVFALTFGNALKEQNDYRNMVIDMVISDLNELSVMKKGGAKYIQVSGSIGFSPVILHMPRDYTILERLLMPSFSEYVPWMAYRLTNQTEFLNLVYDETATKETDLPTLKETVLYNIYGDGKNILVEFKGGRVFEVVF